MKISIGAPIGLVVGLRIEFANSVSEGGRWTDGSAFWQCGKATLNARNDLCGNLASQLVGSSKTATRWVFVPGSSSKRVG